MYWITDEETEEKTIFRLSLRPDRDIFERYTDDLATTLAIDVFSAGLNMNCVVAVRVQLYLSLDNKVYDQLFTRELAELDDINIFCDPRANFPIRNDFISGIGK